MEQVWLRANFRMQLLEMVPGGFFAGAGLATITWGWIGEMPWLAGFGAVIAVVALAMIGMQLWLSRFPRLAYRDGFVLVYLPAPKPLEVPVDHVECFFIGQGPTMLAGVNEREVQAVNVVVRLAERATEWHHREVPLLLAHWCDGYIILRGLFCEPVDGDVVNHLNKLLADVHRERRKTAAEVAK